jgi:hypothetical protein
MYIAARIVSPIILPIEPPFWIPKKQISLLESGKTASWLNGTLIVIPLKPKLIVSVLDAREQGT